MTEDSDQENLEVDDARPLLPDDIEVDIADTQPEDNDPPLEEDAIAETTDMEAPKDSRRVSATPETIVSESAPIKKPTTTPKGKATSRLSVKSSSKSAVPPAATSTPRRSYLDYTPPTVSTVKPRKVEKKSSTFEEGATQALENFNTRIGQITDVFMQSQHPKAATTTPTPSVDDSTEAAHADWLKVLGSKVRRIDEDDVDDFCHEVDEIAFKYLKMAKAKVKK